MEMFNLLFFIYYLGDIMKNIINLVTPFDFEGNIDYDKIKVLLDRFLFSNVDGLVVFGDVSEVMTLNLEERKELLDFIIGYLDKRMEIYVSLSGNLNEILLFNSLIKDKFFYSYIIKVNEGNDTGVIKFITYLSDKLNRNIIIDSDKKLNYEIIRSLSYCKNINGCIVRSADFEYLCKISNLSKENFFVYLANDCLILVGISLGFKGIISVIGNNYPNFVSEVSENTTSSKVIYFKYEKLINDIYKDSKVEAIKYLLKINNLIGDKTRLPYGVCSKVLKRKIEEDYLNL